MMKRFPSSREGDPGDFLRPPWSLFLSLPGHQMERDRRPPSPPALRRQLVVFLFLLFFFLFSSPIDALNGRDPFLSLNSPWVSSPLRLRTTVANHSWAPARAGFLFSPFFSFSSSSPDSRNYANQSLCLALLAIMPDLSQKRHASILSFPSY